MEEQVPSGASEPAARERLLEAAIALFARKGYHAASVREICEAAGVTKPVLYYWFRSKEGLFQELVREPTAMFKAMAAEARSGSGSVSERILRLGERLMALVIEYAAVVRLVDSVYYGPRGGGPPLSFAELYGEFDTTMLGLVEEGIRSGEFRTRDLEGATNALLGALLMCKTTVHLSEDRAHGLHDRPLGVEDVRRVLDVVLDGMRAGGGAGGEGTR